MQRKVIPDSEHKLVILYILSHFGPLTETQLYIFLIDMHLMKYIDLKINQYQMEERGEIRFLDHPLGQLMEITPEGQYALDTFMHHIPASKRALIDRETSPWRSRFRAEQDTPVTFISRQGAYVWYRMRIMEQRATLLDMNIRLEPAHAMRSQDEEWGKQGSRIYAAITADLGQGFLQIPLPDALPPTVDVRPVNASEWMVHLMDDASEPTLTMTLILPDEQLARHYAARWESCRENLCPRIREEMMTHWQ